MPKVLCLLACLPSVMLFSTPRTMSRKVDTTIKQKASAENEAEIIQLVFLRIPDLPLCLIEYKMLAARELLPGLLLFSSINLII